VAGLDLVGLVREEGVSGSHPLHTRPGGAELLTRLQAETIKHVVALKLDRLFRDAVDALQQTRRWDESGVALHLVDMGGQAMNTASAMGRMMLTMMAAFAELERNLISERTEAALAHKRQHHEAYSPTPYGFDREEDSDQLHDNPREAETIRRMKEMRAGGMSYGAMARTLNEEGIPTEKGKRWWPSTVRQILMR
jgi:DNA invertase Pin-like site-specific DNA recombinase